MQGDAVVEVCVIREPGLVAGSERVREVCWNFGVAPREGAVVIVESLRVALRPGRVVLVTGASGSGKSSVLRVLGERLGDVQWVNGQRFPTGRAIVDCIAPRQPLQRALEILGACGLGEARLWLREFKDLSDGERVRACLARAVGLAMSIPPATGKCGATGTRQTIPILFDEFASTLHRRLACALAFNLRRLVSRHGLMLVVAAAAEDFVDDLQPDAIVRLGSGNAVVEERAVEPRAFAVR